MVSTKQDAFLLVEGNNDLHVISALRKKHQVQETFDIVTPKESGMIADGTDQLLENFRVRLLGADSKIIGVVLDADDIPDKRWQQVITRVIKAEESIKAKESIKASEIGYELPNEPIPEGTIIAAPNENWPRIGIWLMPDNESLGELEDFVAFLIPPDDQLTGYANDVLDQIEKNDLNRYKKKKRSKAFIHTWLAWQEKPGMPMGQSITAKALSADSKIAQTFVAWLNRLFNS